MSFDIKNRMGGIKPTQIDLQLLDQLIKNYLEVNSSDLTSFILEKISNHDSEHFDVFYRKEEIDAQRNQLIADINNRFSNLINGADAQLQVLQEITESLQDPNNGVYEVLSNGLAMRLRKDKNLSDVNDKEESRINLDVLKSSIQEVVSNISLKDFIEDIVKDGRYYFTSDVIGLPTEDDYVIDIYSSTKNNKKIYTLIASRIMVNNNPDPGDSEHINTKIYFTQYYENGTLSGVNTSKLLPWVRLVTNNSAVETARNLYEILNGSSAKPFSLDITNLENKLYNVRYDGNFCINMIDRNDLPEEFRGTSQIEQKYFHLDNKVIVKSGNNYEIIQQLTKADSNGVYPSYVRKITSNGEIGIWTKVMTMLDTDSRYVRFDINNQNLPEINKANARQNLGLGDSATKNVGTESNQVAAGDHDHIFQYHTTGFELRRLAVSPNDANAIQDGINCSIYTYDNSPWSFVGYGLISQFSDIFGPTTSPYILKFQLGFKNEDYGAGPGIFFRWFNQTTNNWNTWLKILCGGGFLNHPYIFRGISVSNDLSSDTTTYSNPQNVSTIRFRNLYIMNKNGGEIAYTNQNDNSDSNCNIGVFYSRFSGLSFNSQTVNNIRLEIVNT